MRLFTGIALPEPVSGRLALLIDRLRPAARLKWSRASNLHITTRFIGEWADSRRAELEESLAALGALPSFPIQVRELGWYPNERSPRVLWAGIEAPPELGELAAATDRRLERLGLPPESRPYSPHLTLARIKSPARLRALRAALDELPSRDFGGFRALSFHLYESQLHPSGAIYRSLAEFRLDGAHE